MLGVGLQVVGHLVLGRVAFGVARHGKAGESAVGAGREEDEGGVPVTPAVAHPRVELDDPEGKRRLLEVEPHRKTCLSATDDEDIPGASRHSHTASVPRTPGKEKRANDTASTKALRPGAFTRSRGWSNIIASFEGRHHFGL
jgi:hypothetical protein